MRVCPTATPPSNAAVATSFRAIASEAIIDRVGDLQA